MLCDPAADAAIAMNFRRAGCALCCAAAGLLLAYFLVRITPLHDAVQIGGDEGFEVNKALLWARGYHLYSEVWNDQPPLYTVILGVAFKLFGAAISVARTIALVFGLLFCAAFYWLVKRATGSRLAGAFASVSILMAPGVFRSATAVMLELPAISFALVSLAMAFVWKQSGRTRWLVFSGLALAAALQVKLTAAVLLPAIFFEIVAIARQRKSGQVARLPALWIATLAVGFFALGGIFGAAYGEYWASHASAQKNTPASIAAYSLTPQVFIDHMEGVLGGLLGLVLAIFNRDLRPVRFPIYLLATAFLVHMAHHPWWDYYYLHFAIAFCWLMGFGVARLMTHLQGAWKKRFATFATLAALLLINVAVIGFGGERLIDEVERIRSSRRIADDPVIRVMKKFSPQTKWVFCRTTIEPFHAGLLVIPDLAVLPRKRFWAGLISPDEVVSIARRHAPEQVLLTLDDDPRFQKIVEHDYALVLEDAGRRLYISDRLLHDSPR